MSAAAAQPEPTPGALAITQRDWPLPWMRRFLETMATMPNVAAAARAAGISRFYAYEARERHPEFAEAWAEAREVGLDLAEQIVYQRATTGMEKRVVRSETRRDSEGLIVSQTTVETVETVVSNSMLIAWLRANRPEKWAERLDHRIGGNPDLPPVQVDTGPRRRTAERLAALLQIAQEDERIGPVLEAAIGQDGVARVDGDPA